MEKLDLKLRESNSLGLFHDSRNDVKVLAKSVNTIVKKLNEIVEEINKLKNIKE